MQRNCKRENAQYRWLLVTTEVCYSQLHHPKDHIYINYESSANFYASNVNNLCNK